MIEMTTVLYSFFIEILRLVLLTNVQVRGECQLQSREKALGKLVSLDPKKPGELAEITEVIPSGSRTTLADELADIVYYAVQLDVHPGKWFRALSPILSIAQALGFTPEEALRATVVKYSCRVEHGKDKVREQAEMAKYVATLPVRTENRPAALEQIAQLRATLLG